MFGGFGRYSQESVSAIQPGKSNGLVDLSPISFDQEINLLARMAGDEIGQVLPACDLLPVRLRNGITRLQAGHISGRFRILAQVLLNLADGAREHRNPYQPDGEKSYEDGQDEMHQGTRHDNPEALAVRYPFIGMRKIFR